MNDRRFDQHITEEQLIRALDGELDRAARQLVDAHLESCWGCRHKQQRLRETMDRFTEWETLLLSATEALPPGNWGGLPSRLRTIAPAPPRRQARIEHHVSRALTLVSGAAAMVVLTVWLWPVPTVSAKEIIARSVQSENAAVRHVDNPLVLQRVRIESRRRKAEGDFWSAPKAGQSRQHWATAGDSSLQQEVEQIYASNGLDLRRPVSVANHAAWRQSIAERSDEVEQTAGFVRIRTRNSGVANAGEIAEAQLLLRAADWHPIEQTLTIAGQEEHYRIVETDYEVKSLTAESARVFAPEEPPVYALALPPAMPPAVIHGIALPPSPIVAVPSLPAPPADLQTLLETEVEALFRLHELGADRTEAAVVNRTEQQVEVTVYASGEVRAQAIAEQLVALPHLRLTVHGLQTADSTVVAPSVSAQQPERTEAPLFLQDLVQATGSLPGANLIVSRQLELLRQFKQEASSLEALANRFPLAVETQMSEAARGRLLQLRADHLEAARSLWADARRSSPPLLSAIGPAGAASSPVDRIEACTWPRIAEELSFAARRIEELYSRAFTVVAGADTALRWMTRGALREELASLDAALSDSLERCRP